MSSNKNSTTTSFPRSRVGMQIEHKAKQDMGSHAGAWEPVNLEALGFDV